MDFLTIDLVKQHCRINLYSKNKAKQREIDNTIRVLADKAEQLVYEYIGKNYFDIIKAYGEVPIAIKHSALIITSAEYMGTFVGIGCTPVLVMLLKPYKKNRNRE